MEKIDHSHLWIYVGQGNLETPVWDTPKKVDIRRVTAACKKYEILWPVGFQQACKAMQNDQSVLIIYSGQCHNREKLGVPKWGWGISTPVAILVGVFWQRSCCLENRRNYLIFYYKTLLGSGHLTAMLAKVEYLYNRANMHTEEPG